MLKIKHIQPLLNLSCINDAVLIRIVCNSNNETTIAHN